MAWSVSCSCGARAEGVPPFFCPGCGRLIRDPMDPRDVVDQLAAAAADPVGQTADGEW